MMHRRVNNAIMVYKLLADLPFDGKQDGTFLNIIYLMKTTKLSQKMY